MAYNVKYAGGFYDRQGFQWRVRIWVDGYGGDSQNIDLANPPVILDYNGSDFKYEPFVTSSLEIKIVQTSNYQWREFFVRDEEDYIITLEKYVSTTWVRRWVGYLIPDIATEQYQSPPTILTLRASDGLSRLKGEYYVSSGNNKRNNFYTGLDSLSNIVGKCLAGLRIDLGSSNFTVNRIIEGLNTYEAQHSTADSAGRLSPLTQTRVDQAAFLSYTNDDKIAFSKYEVLENILKIFGARLFLAYDEEQEVLAWHIYTINDYDGTSINRGIYEVYDGTNYYDALDVDTVTLTETISTTVANESTEIIYANGGHEVTFLPAVNEVITRWKPKNQADSRYNNLLPFGEFEYHSNDNISDWNTSTDLRGWTESLKAAYERWKVPPTFYQPNQYVPNNYGVQYTADDMYLTSESFPVNGGYGGQNIFWLGIRTYVVLTEPTGTRLTPSNYVENLVFSGGNAEPPYAKLEVRLSNGSTTYYLKADPSNQYGYKFAVNPPTGAEILFIQYERCARDYVEITTGSPTVVLSDIPAREGAIIDAQWRAVFPAAITDGYEIEVDLYACRRASTNAQERVIEYDNSISTTTTKTEEVNTVYEYVRVNVSTGDGIFGSGDIKYAAANANVRTTFDPIEIETVIGDPIEGEGFNVGSLRYNDGGTIGPPTENWQWNGSIPEIPDAGAFTIHRLLADLVSRAYASPTLKLTGDFSTADNVYPYKHFQLSDNSETKDLMLTSMSWNVQEDLASCEFVEVEDTDEAPTVIEIFTEDVPQVGQASNGSITSYSAPAVTPNIGSI